MKTLYTLSTTTYTVPNNPSKSLYNDGQENIPFKVPHCCENCANRPTKDDPMRACHCVLPSLEQIKW